MKQFIKTIVPTEGYTEVKQVGNKWVVHLEGVAGEDGITTCYECMTDAEPDLAVLSQELQEYKTYRAERDLELAKKVKIAELMVYDESDAVNSFELLQNGVKIIDYWMKPDLRTSLEGDVIAFSKVQDYYNFDIRELGITLPLNCKKFLAALDDLKRYAVRSFNNTSLHLAAIQQLTSKEEVEAYDFTTGYPEKLSFDIVNLMSNE